MIMRMLFILELGLCFLVSGCGGGDSDDGTARNKSSKITPGEYILRAEITEDTCSLFGQNPKVIELRVDVDDSEIAVQIGAIRLAAEIETKNAAVDVYKLDEYVNIGKHSSVELDGIACSATSYASCEMVESNMLEMSYSTTIDCGEHIGKCKMTMRGLAGLI